MTERIHRRRSSFQALDLFCGAGGAAMGLHRAGFDVVGVDIKPQPRYPFKFCQADAMTFPLAGFAFIWASPICQGYTAMRHAPGAKGDAHPKLIGPIRDRLQAAGVPWCIENVEEARWDMRDPITLCGSMFGLGAQGCQLQRHRLFECSFPIEPPPCRHDDRSVIGVYGGHARRRAASAGGRGTRDVWRGGHKAAASEAMGIDWMTLNELSEAIPPAYAEYIGQNALIAAENFRLKACGKWLRDLLTDGAGTTLEWEDGGRETVPVQLPWQFDALADTIERVSARLEKSATATDCPTEI